jgi:hypothetical protein
MKDFGTKMLDIQAGGLSDQLENGMPKADMGNPDWCQLPASVSK